MEQEESIQLVSHTPEEYENLQVMAKYWRSKSLPVVCMPPPLGLVKSRETNYFEPSTHAPIHAKPPLAEIRESSEDSDCRSGGTRNSSLRSDKTNNTLLLNEKLGPERRREGSNSSGQEARDSKKKSEWRTLQQHYYPEGDWGWIVTVCAVMCHAITTGLQLYLSNIVYERFHEGV